MKCYWYVVYELTGGICQIYSPAFVWDDVITRVYLYIGILSREESGMLTFPTID